MGSFFFNDISCSSERNNDKNWMLLNEKEKKCNILVLTSTGTKTED